MWMRSKLLGVAIEAALTALRGTHDAEVQRLTAENDRLQRAVAVLDAKRALLKEALAISQTNVDWLRVQVNTLTMDRAAIAAAKGIELPAPVIEGRPQTPAQVEARAAAAAKEPAGLAELPDDLDAAMEKFGGLAGGFEDVGDQAAEVMGIRHTDEGDLEYSK